MPDKARDDGIASLVRDRIADFRKASAKPLPCPPPDLRLRPYQKDGFVCSPSRRLRARHCLADDMGLGKTIPVLALLTAPASDSLARS